MFMDFGSLMLKSNQPTEGKGQKRILLQGNELIHGIPDEMRRKDPGVRLSTDDGILTVNPDDLSTGVLAVGSTGCGKTTLFFKMLDSLIPAISNNDVMFIFDSKGDYKDRYYRPQNPNHIVISVSAKDRAVAKSWNLYGELFDSTGRFGEDTELIVGEISKALFKGMESQSQPFFSISAEDLFSKFVLSFIRDAARNYDLSKLNNQSLFSFISADNKQLIEQATKYSDFKYLTSYVGDGSSNQALGVYGYLMSMKNRIFVSTLRNKQPNGDFSIRRLVRERGGKIVFLEYDMQYADTLSTVYSLFYDLAIKEALSSSQNVGNTYFICDELNLIPYTSRLEELLNFGRSKGCKTIVGLQSVAQLKKNYSDAEAASILAGFLTAMCFKNADYDTRRYVKERFGETFEVYNFGGTNVTRNGFTVNDSDIIGLRAGEAIIDMKGIPPFVTRFIKSV